MWCVSFSPLSVPLGLNLLLSRFVHQFPHGHRQAKPHWRSSQQNAMCGLKVRTFCYYLYVNRESVPFPAFRHTISLFLLFLVISYLVLNKVLLREGGVQIAIARTQVLL